MFFFFFIFFFQVREKPSEGKAAMEEIQKLINSRFHLQSGTIKFKKKMRQLKWIVNVIAQNWNSLVV